MGRHAYFKVVRYFLRFSVNIKGFNLVELVVVTIVLGIIVAIAIPAYTRTRERILDKDAISSLQLIRAAETNYRMDNGAYSASLGTNAAINLGLRLSLVTINANWNYTVTNGGVAAANIALTATRNNNGVSGRHWDTTVADVSIDCTSVAPDTCF